MVRKVDLDYTLGKEVKHGKKNYENIGIICR